jgi:hypothetical protein
VLLAATNRFGGAAREVAEAVRHIEAEGDADGFLAAASRRSGWRQHRVRSMLNQYRGIGALHLSSPERLALEMAVHEEAERRAMHGELAALEAAWRDADEIARIVDVELT